jgi:hypothetical protein
MGRFILRFTGGGAVPEVDLERIRSAQGLTVVDGSSRQFLVQASPETVGRLVETLPGWISSPLRMVPLPDTRPKIRSS